MTGNRGLPQVLVVAAFLTVTAVLLVWLSVGRAVESPAAGPTTTAALTQRMRITLEHLPADQHQGHGGHVGTAGQPSALVCGARVYGYEPAEAPTVDDVVTVYGYHMCALAEPGRSWKSAMKLVAPLVMRFDTKPPQLQIAESSDGVSYRDRVKQLFPARYQKSAYELGLEPAALADLRRRFEAAAGPATEPAG
jgi:hypothetical protein